MKQFLSLIEPLLAASQAERLAAIIRKRQAKEGAGTPAETQEELSRLLQMTEKTSQLKPAFTVRPPMFDREVMDGDHFNSHMEAFEIDVHNLYEMANNLTGSTLGMQNILHSRIESFRAQLCRLSDDIFSYQHLKNTDGFARVITQGFADGRNPTMAGVPARVDPQTRSLKLPATEQTRHHQERGIQPAQVVVTNLSAGLTGVASRTFEEENAIDPDPESFWAEVLLASGPLQTDYTFLSGATQTFPGALVQVNLVLGSPEFVSDVKILPFGDYPVRVVDVKYKQSGNEFQFPGYVDRNPSLNWLEWHGLRVLADEIIFVLQQETYTKVRYHIPKLTVALTSFWEQLLDEETRLVIEDQNLTDFQKQKAEADARFSSLWEGMRKYGLELERRDIPAPDPLGQTIPSAEVLHRTVDAASQAMTGDPEQKLRLRSLQSEKEIDQSKLVEIERYEYVFGARELQANDIQFLPEGHYQTPRYAPDATILGIRINPVEEHPSFSDSNGSFRRTSIEYDIEIAPGRRVPVLPSPRDNSFSLTGLGPVQDELLIVDRVSRQAVTRFVATGSGATIRKDGVVTTEFSTEVLPDSRLRFTIDQAAFSTSARYSVSYTASTAQAQMDVQSLYDSVLLEQPETFVGTDDTGSIELKLYPFVEYGVVNNEGDFKREGSRSAKWFWIGGSKQTFLDGFMYGDVNTALDGAVASTDTTITLDSTAQISTTGQLKIGTEVVTYTGKTATDITGVTRGESGTTAQDHPDNLGIVGERIYEPLIVFVGDVRAFNITNYLTGRHPAFLAGGDNEQRYEFLHVGRRLFFNRPIADRPITVRYRWMSQYIQVLATLRSHAAVRGSYTPTLRRFHIEVESTVL